MSVGQQVSETYSQEYIWQMTYSSVTLPSVVWSQVLEIPMSSSLVAACGYARFTRGYDQGCVATILCHQGWSRQ
jgi:hypothetical protein